MARKTIKQIREEEKIEAFRLGMKEKMYLRYLLFISGVIVGGLAVGITFII